MTAAGERAIAVLPPASERTKVVAELADAGFDPVVVADADELEAAVATRDVRVAVLDPDGSPDRAAELRDRLHAQDRRIPALLVCDLAALENAHADGIVHPEDEHLVRPYTSESLRWRVEAICIRRAAVDDGSGPVLQGALGEGWGRRGQLVALFNPKGGVGKTTIGANLAAVLAGRGRRVLLVDGDPVTGHIGVVIGLDARTTLADAWAQTPAGEPDPVLEELATTHPTGLRYLPLAANPLATEALEPGRVAAALGAARADADVVVVDLHPSYSPLNRAVFEAADRILVPVTPDLPALRVVMALREIAEELGVRERIRLVVNRAGSGVAVDAIEKVVGMPVWASVRSDGQTLLRAVNEGRTLPEVAPRERITAEIAALATLVDGASVAPAKAHRRLARVGLRA